MKRVFINVLVLLVAYAINACEKPSNDDGGNTNPQEQPSTTTAMPTMDEQYDSAFLASIKGSIDRKSGDFINSNEAYGMLARYKDNRRRMNSQYNPNKDIYGFTFGVDMLDSLVKNIKAVNKEYPDSLVGVRVYFAGKRITGKHIPDVFLIAVDSNGKNVYHVDNDFDNNKDFTDEDPLILNNSIPCPNNCD